MMLMAMMMFNHIALIVESSPSTFDVNVMMMLLKQNDELHYIINDQTSLNHIIIYHIFYSFLYSYSSWASWYSSEWNTI